MLLANMPGMLAPWVNFVLHYLMPVVVVVDWLVQPPKSQMSTRQIAYWLIYPILAFLANRLPRTVA